MANPQKNSDEARKQFNRNAIRDPDKITNEFLGKTLLIEAILKKDTAAVEELLASGANPDKGDKNFVTPLHHAVRMGALDIVKLLQQYDVEMNPRDFWLATPQHDAVRCPNAEVMTEYLLQTGGDPDIANSRGRLPLHLAAENGTRRVVSLLAAATKNLSAPDDDGVQPFLRACYRNDVDVLKAMLYERIDLFTATKTGDTCMHIAASRLSYPTDAAYYLFENTDAVLLVNAVNHAGQSPLHLAVISNKIELARDLILAGANVNLPDNKGRTPLGDAAYLGNQPMMKMLLDQGADVKKEVPYEETSLLMLAIAAGKPPIIRYLLEEGVDPNAANQLKVTALMKAAANATNTVTALLLEFGADASPLDKADRNVLHHIGKLVNADIVKKLVAAGADPNQVDAFKRPPLVNALMNYQAPDILTALLESGADPNVTGTRGEHVPLIMILNRRNLAVFELALKKKADPNLAETALGGTALHSACMLGADREVLLLLAAGAKPNAQNHNKETPLQQGMHYGSMSNDTLKKMLEAGADPLQPDKNGTTAYDIANVKADKGYLRVMDEFLKKKEISYKPKPPHTPPFRL
jgi:ankyrin repeat protein